MHFPNYGLEKTWLDKCLKTVFISGDPRHLTFIHLYTFIIFSQKTDIFQS